MALTQVDQGLLGTYAQYTGFKNRIINGAMMISQRNGTSAVTIDGAASYTLDRYLCQDNTDGSYTVQQSSTAPTGFVNSLLVTITGTDSSLTTTQFGRIVQRIEGLNIADLNWGSTAASAGQTASTVTLSFWVRSSVTGTFSGSLVNDGGNRVYAFTYTISSANTWEQKSVTIAGDTTGTWLTTNGTGIELNLSIGAGPDRTVSAGSWGTSLAYAATGQTNLFATNGATFYITGVQLEKGSTATSFDYRPYGTELQLAQRYYYRVTPDVNAPFSVGFNASATQAYTNVSFPVVMRITPTAVEQTGTASNYRVRHSGGGTACSSVPSIVNGSPSSSFIIFAVASGLTTGQAAFGESNLAGAYLGWSAEL